MTITLHIPQDIEAKIHEYAARGDADAVHHLLVEALGPAVESLIHRHTLSKPSHDDFELLADQLANEFMEYIAADSPPLSDDAVNRQGLYEDHL
ncbi:hypothetical protein [Candidatus Entotheonella palauensis]|uniref:Uncharacterized protein n=1 Tax=Candidatus Entotheonella gemina TaxID=1429439 RepID=W4LQE0_9BACT|nr:hypothetical protein [Candidatus Entotheonella palauensis]ETW99940.1 MAG: hypothetical protein ETSY2_40005 [Candidatus Entotheonella gemina]